jgi:hypothetical protein
VGVAVLDGLGLVGVGVFGVVGLPDGVVGPEVGDVDVLVGVLVGGGLA